MKKSHILLSALGAVLIGCAVAFFVFRGSSDAYLNALPRDMTSVARLDFKSFVGRADLGLKDILQLLRRQDEMDIRKLGIDVQRPIYFFTSLSVGNFGLLAAVDDEDELTQLLESYLAEGVVSEIVQRRGYSWVIIQNQWFLAFDSEKALLMGPAAAALEDRLTNEMVALLDQKKDDSGRQSPLFAALSQADEPLAAVVAPEIMPAQARDYLRQYKVASQEDALMRFAVDADDNELEIEGELLTDKEAVLAELARVEEVMRPVRGELIDHAHAENIVWITANLDGLKLLELMRSNMSVRTALLGMNFIFDLDRLISALDGDLAIELTNASSFSQDLHIGNQLNNLFLTAQVSSPDFLSGAAKWGNGLFGVQPLSTNEFALQVGEAPYYFGVVDKTFYLGSERGIVAQRNEYLRQQRDDIRDCRFYATLHLPELLRQMKVDEDAPPIIRQTERLNIKIESARELKVEFVAPRGTNFIRELLSISNE